ncbi:MAG TPA: phosphatidylglycerol lysyltransferase domain-containing protein [Spirochaetota bacterium]|nr:phosphatidylglycerol lysyltransferase domain-containing protein [Spirochaetota bacterium]
MRSEKLDLGHLDILYWPLKETGVSISEYSFSNLFLFRMVHDYEVLFDHEIFIRGTTYDGVRHLMPLRDPRGMDPAYLLAMAGEADMFYPISEQWLEAFDRDRYDITFLDGDMDYVFTSEKIATYKGKKLHNKRNLLQQFYSQYRHEALPLGPERKADALRVLDAWQRETGLEPAETDYQACIEALTLQNELLLCGGIYYADDEPVGFILGEGINNDMFALHFAKGLRSVKGVYQFMYNNCASVLHQHYTYVNFEQDLGKLPLRQAKASYVPDMMIRKYRVHPKA